GRNVRTRSTKTQKPLVRTLRRKVLYNAKFFASSSEFLNINSPPGQAGWQPLWADGVVNGVSNIHRYLTVNNIYRINLSRRGVGELLQLFKKDALWPVSEISDAACCLRYFCVLFSGAFTPRSSNKDGLKGLGAIGKDAGAGEEAAVDAGVLQRVILASALNTHQIVALTANRAV